ncbi:SpoIIE family protein phosphatase [Kineococcus rubinsiae]|uniref:SpoIIE family protein phosphatase n=1 Tax=Kineococcus rubinsiae TaxID=2609562 RepID=UPI001430BBE1|nr:SpoIIE family protein phosphatase [Kineococcus rubinsiae]NIZ90388.1 SpoIIE family protein phosphatase [Kineococcus rubinsiae]
MSDQAHEVADRGDSLVPSQSAGQTASEGVTDPRPEVMSATTLNVELPSVVHDYPAAVLLIDTGPNQDTGFNHVVYVNDLARQLAPDASLPIGVEDWSRAAGLKVDTGAALSASSTPLSQLAAGEPESGRQISAALQSQATHAREALWAIGMPLRGAPQPLRARSLLVLMPLRFPDAVADVQAAAVSDRARGSVLASELAIAISDPTAADDPLIWVSPSFEHLTGYTSTEVLGYNCRFLQGRDTDPAAVQQLREGLAAQTTVSQTLLNYRHDGSAFYNHLVISPVFDADGTLTHHVSVQSDVTGQVLAQRERETAMREAERARQAQAAAQQAQAAAEEAGRFGQLLLRLSEALTATVSLQEVTTTLTGVLADELGAVGGGLLLPDVSATQLNFTTLHDMPAGTDAAWTRIGWQEDAPAALAARTRRAVFYPDTQALLAAHPSITTHAALAAMGASAHLPLVAGHDVVGVLFLYWDRPHQLTAQQQEALRALARYTAQAVQCATLINQRRSAAEVLQRSLLTHLPEPDHLELRARYVPAAAGEHVGGDWYDAVVLPEGATTVIIGDVTGHDMVAAAHMGQLRGLLRAYAFDREEAPAAIVSRLDRALSGLGIDGLATLVVACIEQSDHDKAAGLRRLRWTNAGHPPPVLLHVDGSTEVLESEPELLMGLLPATTRTDHVHVLPPGSTLLLYTDGLVEHRGRSISDGISDLRRVLSTYSGQNLQELLDHLVHELVGDSPDDDCAILAVRAHREDRDRPAEAGPNRLN